MSNFSSIFNSFKSILNSVDRTEKSLTYYYKFLGETRVNCRDFTYKLVKVNKVFDNQFPLLYEKMEIYNNAILIMLILLIFINLKIK